MNKIKLPALDFEDINPPTVPPYRPDESTMNRFDHERGALRAACNLWLDTIRNPPEDWTDAFDCAFAQLTRALQLWASLHGLGDGAALSGKDLGQAEAFIDLIKDRAAMSDAAVKPTSEKAPRVPKGSAGYTPNELAKILRVSPDRVRAWIKRGELEATNNLTRRGKPRYVITPDALAKFQARHKAAEGPTTPAPRRRRQEQGTDYFPD